jgi:hypothetical protein
VAILEVPAPELGQENGQIIRIVHREQRVPIIEASTP